MPSRNSFKWDTRTGLLFKTFVIQPFSIVLPSADKTSKTEQLCTIWLLWNQLGLNRLNTVVEIPMGLETSSWSFKDRQFIHVSNLYCILYTSDQQNRSQSSLHLNRETSLIQTDSKRQKYLVNCHKEKSSRSSQQQIRMKIRGTELTQHPHFEAEEKNLNIHIL